MDHKQLIQAGYAMQVMRYEDTEVYNLLSKHMLRMLHIYEADGLYRILDLFSPKIEETIEDKIILEEEIKIRKKS